MLEHAATGGHMGPNLGVVELTIALHRVFTRRTRALIRKEDYAAECQSSHSAA